MAASQADVAAKLIERLLADPAFRARFRRDPAGACREAGLDELAAEMSLGGGKAMHTLDLRESKSSLAGVMMAAAMEGVGIYELTENVLPHLEAVPGHVADVLSRVDLPAIPGLHHGGGAAAHAAEAAPSGGGGGAAAEAAPSGGGATADAAAGSGPAADSVPAPPAAAGDAVAQAPAGGGTPDAAATSATPSGAAATAADGKSGAGSQAAEHGKAAAEAATPKRSAAKKAAKKIAESLSSRSAHKHAASDASAALDSHTTGLPDSSDLPDTPPTGDAATAGADAATATPGGGTADAAPATPGGGTTDAATSTTPAGGVTDAAPADAAASTTPGGGAATDALHEHAAAAADGHGTALDPTQFGQAGSGGPPTPEALALLHDKNVVLDAHGISDLQAGRVDPRVVGVLTKLSQEHKITVSNLCSEQFTTGGSVSNHQLGRGVDISAIDGHIVDAGNPIAREVASELSSLEPGIRPTEIGSPWAISGPGYFTDATHHNLLHIGFKESISPDWKPPADVAAPGAAAAAAPAEVATPAAAPSDVPTPAPVAVPAAAPVAPPVAAAASAPAGVHGPADEQFFDQAVAAGRPARRVGAGDAFFSHAVDPKPAAAPVAPAGGAVAQAASVGTPGGSADAAAASFTGGPDTYPGDNASQAQIAAWMAAEAQKRGLPPQLPVMASLVESGVKNLNFGDRDSVGFFQMRVGTWNQGAYAGFPDHPELQVKWFLDQAEAVKAQRIARGESVTDPHQYGDWIADIERPAEQYRGRYGLRLDQANGLLAQHAAAPAPAAALPAPVGTPAPSGATADAATSALAPTAAAGNGGGSPLGAAALQIAESQKGVHEIGSTNTGPQVDQYLAAAGVSPGNPWCASFVTWSLEHAGHKMPGSGWAAVSTWVHSAEQHQNGLQIIPPDQARPGDIVAYDWGGGTDFSSDGHIGFLASNVQNGQFNALEGNNADAVNLVPRHLGGGPNIVFIRADGNATTPPDPTAVTPAGATPLATAASAPPTPAAAAAAATPTPPALHGPADEQFFDQAVAAGRPARRVGAGDAFFSHAVDPKPAAAPVAPAGGAVAQAASVGTPGGSADAAAASFTGGPDTYPGDNASQAQIAAWMAAEAQKRGLPPQLPVMASLVESGVKNLNFGDRDSVGFFQMRVGTWNQGAYAGFPDHPELQVKWFLDQAEAVKAQRIARGESVTDPHQYGDWIADIERPAEQYRGRYGLRLDQANGLLAQHAAAPAPAAALPAPVGTPAPSGATADAATSALAPTAAAGNGGGSPLGAAALQIAESQKGVHEIGSTNTGPQVDQYLAAAGVSPGNPWCASFVTWSLEHAGHKMPGSGWAAVSTWVHSAEQHQNGLQIIPPDQARPGDIVAYDWGGGTDFSSDGHIGFLASNVQNGQFNALEGNNADAVNLVPRHLGGGPNIVFIRADGNATTPPDPTAVTPAGATPLATAASAPPTPAAAAAAATPTPPALHGPADEQFFDQAVASGHPEAKVRHASAMFLKAIDPSQQVKPATATPPAPAPVAAAASVQPAPAPAASVPADAAAPASTGAPADHAAAAIDLSSAAAGYPGDHASQAQLAQWLGGQAQKAGLPPELPVMASLVESGVRNLDYGDRDSVGFFQMRVGIWDQGAYAGFQHRPELQAQWFIDHALAVKRQAIANGDANFGQDPASYGEWIADVEQCAAQYRSRYQLRLDEARGLLAG